MGFKWSSLDLFILSDGGAVENRTPVRNHATPNVYMFRKVVKV